MSSDRSGSNVNGRATGSVKPVALHIEYCRPNASLTMAQDDLWRYGFKVLKKACRTGRIVSMCQAAGLPIHMTEEQLRTLHSSMEDRDELAVETLLRAVPYFRRNVLDTGRWDPRQSTLETYFVGCCLRAFVVVFRRWAHARNVRLGELGFGLSDATLDEVLPATVGTAPEGAAEVRDTLRTIMRNARPEARMICYLILQDLTYAEIGAKLDGISARAVEGHMSRLRRTVQRLARRGHIDVPKALAKQPNHFEVA